MTTIDILPVTGLPEVRSGHDLSRLLLAGLERSRIRLRDGDVVVVTQKVVSKAEGRVVPIGEGGKAAWVAREARRIVARRGDLIIAETRHGFVCANAGVDESNVDAGFVTLLPVAPDASAERIQTDLGRAFGASLGVVITDTFGRPWRQGLVNVAIGCAGLPALVDLRGTLDAGGRPLEVTVVALADEIAAASGLVMGKAGGIPAAVVRGVRAGGPHLPAASLIRPKEDDLFPSSPLMASGRALAAVILCGGSGTRMGRDKAVIEVDGEPLVHRVAGAIGRVANPVLLAPGRPGRLGTLAYGEVADDPEGAGPLGGMIAGLGASPHPLAAVVAVDMPFASPEVIALLAGRWAGEDALVPVTDAGPQPLHALYARSALPTLRAAVASGRRAVRDAVAVTNVRYVGPQEWRPADPSGRFAHNLNRAEDLAGLP
jgi:coenzyme F420-0:L-glutamate ligase / coenzyme F420-1:gamma-L-glutamate ligase